MLLAKGLPVRKIPKPTGMCSSYNVSIADEEDLLEARCLELADMGFPITFDMPSRPTQLTDEERHLYRYISHNVEHQYVIAPHY